ncbi:sulfotransferase [Balneolaceae bacterium YR4-1]|uniref:Sulfotransferase n=1 Tax=Halalkalibaculum roseum TaxID=2709311 RepID=A0A6M1T4G9_9BACT|nr:sulfotransferase [Halalkalibaculum roseum]NGP76895.1 sulfotransferase [Halalkalibaculum roseum]
MYNRRHPIHNLTIQLRKNRAFSKENLPKIALFYFKLLLQEPLRILEEVNYAHAIDDHRFVKDPIFIIGHWRSGTSFLQYLLGQDDQFGYINKFQVVFPDIFLYSESFLKPFISKIPETFNLTQDAQDMSIDLDLDSPSEIEIALSTMISPASLHWGHIFPQKARRYFDKFLFLENTGESELNRLKRDYNHLIKKISLDNEGKQLIIKSPGNAARIPFLLDLYPNAKFIFIHRNPYDTFYSSKKLWHTLLDNLALQPMSKKQMEDEIIRTYQKLMTSYLQQRELLPEGQLVELRFNQFIGDPVNKLAKVYEALTLDGYQSAEGKFNQFLEQKTKGKSSSYRYEDRILDRINSKWDFAFREWGYDKIGCVN